MNHMHPSIANEFQKVFSDLDEITDENRQLSAKLQDEKRARELLERQEVHIDDMPGKQLPFRCQINIPLPVGSDDPVDGVVNVSRDGPFVCRRIYVSAIVTDAPIVTNVDGDVLDYTRSIGRYIPVTSSSTYDIWAGASASGIVPSPDFQWKYRDSGSERNRQDKPISGDVFNRRDDDGYLMNNEIFAAGSAINFTVVPTRPFSGIFGQPPGEDVLEVEGTMAIQLQVTFDGFKILQPLEM